MGLYMAITGVLGVFSTMSYSQAILLEKDEKNATEVLWVSRYINIFFTIITIILVISTRKSLGILLNNSDIANYILLAPISIFFSGQNQIYRIWANRIKKYTLLSINTITTALIIPILSICFGLLTTGARGLFIALLAGHIISPLILKYQLRKHMSLNITRPNMQLVRNYASKYSNFPKYSLGADFISNFSNQIPVFFLSRYFGSSVVGLFQLSNRLLGLPTTILGSSIAEVYRQKANEEFLKHGTFQKVHYQTLKILSILSFLGFGITFLSAENIINVLFGQEWINTGKMIKIMCIYYCLRLINSPLSYAIIIKGKQKIDLIASIWFGLSSVLVFVIANHLGLNYFNVLLAFSINYAIAYLIMINYSLYLSKL